MKPWIKTLIWVTIGFGAGFGSGFFCHKKMNDIRFEEITEDEMTVLEKGQEAIRKIKESKEAEALEAKKKAIDSAENDDQLRNAMQGKISYIKADAEAKEKYATAWSAVHRYSDKENADELPVDGDAPFDPEEGFDEEFLETLEQEEMEPGQEMPPHLITLGEFYNERPDYDKVTIDYFEPDHEFRDEQEEVIADISSYVGMNNVAKLFEKNGPDEDPDIRFIRNEHYNSDYEIVRHHQGYLEMTEGRNYS